MLEVSHLTRCYGDFKAVDNVSFSIGKGEIVGLLGHNGAGKTTIMKMLSGYLEPNQGKISIAGLDIENNANQIQSRLGYLPENLPIYAELTVADYLDYAAELKGLQANEKLRQIKRVIMATELADQLLSPINTLSRGFKQRVGVAQALLGDPQLLILDEPTNGLDPTQTEHMRRLIRDIASQATVILSTHIMQEVDALCDRALILRDGQLVVDAKLADLRQSNALILDTSLTLAQLQKDLQPIHGITGIAAYHSMQAENSESASNTFRIQVAEQSQLKSLGAQIAAKVIHAQGDLFSLSHEHRDLETLFRQVNQGAPLKVTEEVKDAA